MFEASNVDKDSKSAIFSSFLEKDRWRQEEFNALSSCFYNRSDRAQCEYFVDLWFENLEAVEENFHRDYFL